MNTPELAHLMGLYFHEDFDIYDGTLWGALKQYVAESQAQQRIKLIAEIKVVLDRLQSEAELDQFLDRLDSCVYMAETPGGYRGWLEEIARRVEASLTP